MHENIRRCKGSSGAGPAPLRARLRRPAFLRAVRLLAPGDQFLYCLASAFREEEIPEVPGAAALELVAAFHKQRFDRGPIPRKPRKRRGQCGSAGAALAG